MGEGALSSQLDEGAGNAAVDDDSDDNEGGVNVERGMDGERIFKTGFLIKKQERRKVGDMERMCG
jgi:hypothetical protein